jgi:hypothetical protein
VFSPLQEDPGDCSDDAFAKIEHMTLALLRNQMTTAKFATEFWNLKE